MKHILILDDTLADIQIIKHCLEKSRYATQFSVIQGTAIEDYLRLSKQVPIDLLLLDLEFTSANTTSISFMQLFSPELPIIIVSHHSHYQHLLNSTGRISGFIPKSALDDMLVPVVEKTLGYSTQIPEESFVFPIAKSGIAYKIPTKEVRFIQKTGRTKYEIHTISGKSVSIEASTWNDMLTALKKQNIITLKPVSQGYIININCISSIEKERSGLYKITLVNLPHLPFTLSPKFEGLFKNFLFQS